MVLIVEDDHATRQLLSAIAGRVGCTALDAADGHDALELIATHEVDLVLLDLLMPRVNGFDLLQHVRDTKPDLLARIIVLTAASGPMIEESPELKQVRCVMRKPMDVDQLIEEMRGCLASRNVGASDGEERKAG